MPPTNIQNNTYIKNLNRLKQLFAQNIALLKPTDENQTKALNNIIRIFNSAASIAQQAIASVEGGQDVSKLIKNIEQNKQEEDLKSGENITMPAPTDSMSSGGAKTVARASTQKESKNKKSNSDYEYQMARNQLDTAKRSIDQLTKMMGNKKDGNLEAWVQSKITLAVDYLNTVANYMTSNSKQLKEMTSAAGGDISSTVMKPKFGKEQNIRNKYIERSPEDETDAAHKILDEEEDEEDTNKKKKGDSQFHDAENVLREEIKESIRKLYHSNKKEFNKFYKKALLEQNVKNKDKTYFKKYKIGNQDEVGFQFAVQTYVEIGKKIEEASGLVKSSEQDYKTFTEGLLKNIDALCNEIESNMTKGQEISEPVVGTGKTTGESTLIGLFLDIRGVIEGYYRDLKTSPEQRQSYKQHLLNMTRGELMQQPLNLEQPEEIGSEELMNEPGNLPFENEEAPEEENEKIKV
jgi:hypothetical protein